MKPRRLIQALLVAAVALLATALPAAGKEGVKATLTTKIPLDAKPGTELKVAWTLTSVDENGHRQPFGAGGVFVRLLSATGARAETAFAPAGSGTFTATVAVPAGGIGDVQIGIRGRTTFGTSNLVFLITNDPLPGPPPRAAAPRPPRAASPASGQPVSADDGSKAWLLVILAGSAFVLGPLVAAAVARHSRVPGRAGS